ncbi:MAG: anti-sigma factor family protein [Candidatus Methylomirabilaceae bacterium]
MTSLILDYLSGEMEAGTRSDFVRHLRDCPDCVAFLATYEKTVEATRSLRYGDIPSEMRQRVRHFLRERISRPPAGR